MDFKGEFDYVPHRDFCQKNEKCCYENFMSGDWVWMQAVFFQCLSLLLISTNIQFIK